MITKRSTHNKADGAKMYPNNKTDFLKYSSNLTRNLVGWISVLCTHPEYIKHGGKDVMPFAQCFYLFWTFESNKRGI